MFEVVKLFEYLPVSARSAYSSARKRALSKQLPILSRAEFLTVWERAAGKCEFSRITFSDDVEVASLEANYKRSNSYPWQPSLDQIEPGFGYASSNCQLVCKVVNIGKSGYQNDTFRKWVLAVAKQLEAEMP